MRILISKSHIPAFNLATEEYLLRNSDDEWVFFYINTPSVIVGKHQNTLAEVNYSLARQNNIAIHRRLSGGGAVYHDMGNLNFCFIKNGVQGHLVDFQGFTKPVVAYLASIGVEAFFGGHNDLRCGPYKVSGNAEHIYRQRVMHHGTLLVHTNLDVLNTVLWAGREYTDKAVKSVRATVANLSDILNKALGADEVMSGLAAFIEKASVQNRIGSLSDSEMDFIQGLVREKYDSWDWNFGYSPRFTVKRNLPMEKEILALTLTIENGRIVKVVADNVLPGGVSLAFLEGTPFKPEELVLCFGQSELSRIFPTLSFQEMANFIL